MRRVYVYVANEFTLSFHKPVRAFLTKNNEKQINFRH